MKKRVFAAILAMAMALVLLPATTRAAGESGIQLGTDGIGTDDEVYFGNYSEAGTTYDVPWRVLSTGGTSAFLLSKYALGMVPFRPSGTDYSGSTLQAAMDGIYNGFDTGEKGAVVATELTDVSVTGAHLYPLSSDEASNRGYFADDADRIAQYIRHLTIAMWWLRSSVNPVSVDIVDNHGYNGGGFDVYNPVGVRPAFNLDLNAVLFTSAAAGGKPSGTVGAGALHPNVTPSGAAAWKLTLLDNANHGAFDATTTAVSTTPAGVNVSIRYTNATTGTNEYLSAMLVNGSNQVLYYGRLKKLASSTDASGEQVIAIPALAVGSYRLKVFNEQYNGDYNTDYASALKDVSLTTPPKTGDNATPLLWAVLAALTGAGLAASMMPAKRKRED